MLTKLTLRMGCSGTVEQNGNKDGFQKTNAPEKAKDTFTETFYGSLKIPSKSL